jgi:ABC-2 type transport system ATP-binding protein
MQTEIFIHQLRKKYPKGPEALKGVHLTINKGELFTLLGPNGAGKSTLVKIISTLLPKDSGTFTIAGFSPEANREMIHRYIGVVSQDNELDPAETTESILRFQGRLFGLSKQESETRANELIAEFELHEYRHKKCETLSGGNKRRLHCALALVHKPKLIILDEPTVGMDPEARARFWQVITKLNKQEGATIFLTTQYLEEADKHATSMALINNGIISYVGSVTSFKQQVNTEPNITLEETYLSYIGNLHSQPVEATQ